VSLPRRSEVTVEDDNLLLDRIGDDGPAQLRHGNLVLLPVAAPPDLVGTWASPLDGVVGGIGPR
jgi:hypothetical protein